MSEVKQVGQKACLAKQGSSRTQEEKERVWTLGARTGNTGGLQRCCLPLQVENLCSQELIKVQAGQ